jgi:Fungal specific transcription factor domain
MRIDPADSNYLQFFFIQAPMFLLFTQHFPTATSAVFDLASRHKPTLESILAVSAQHADMMAGRQPTRAMIHLSKCLPEIQSALSTVQINEGHIAAVYCLTRLYFAKRDRVAARNHLRGLFLMLKAYQQGPLDGFPPSPLSPVSPGSNGTQSPRPPSPLMMFLWRIAIQMDLALGNRGQDLVFPSPAPNQDYFHRTWISRIASPEATEWALAEFALDDLHHHVLSLEKQAYKIRAAPYYIRDVDEGRIAKGVDKLWCMHHDWKAREIVREAARQENLWRAAHPTTPEDQLRFQFLQYGPPLRFQNEFFVRMLLYHTERIIQIDMILEPRLTEPSPRRVRATIEVCRIIAGVEDMAQGRGGIGQYFQGLNNAGIVFDPKKYSTGTTPFHFEF